jgi:hypothetical protein
MTVTDVPTDGSTRPAGPGPSDAPPHTPDPRLRRLADLWATETAVDTVLAALADIHGSLAAGRDLQRAVQQLDELAATYLELAHLQAEIRTWFATHTTPDQLRQQRRQAVREALNERFCVRAVQR